MALAAVAEGVIFRLNSHGSGKRIIFAVDLQIVSWLTAYCTTGACYFGLHVLPERWKTREIIILSKNILPRTYRLKLTSRKIPVKVEHGNADE